MASFFTAKTDFQKTQTMFNFEQNSGFFLGFILISYLFGMIIGAHLTSRLRSSKLKLQNTHHSIILFFLRVFYPGLLEVSIIQFITFGFKCQDYGGNFGLRSHLSRNLACFGGNNTKSLDYITLFYSIIVIFQICILHIFDALTNFNTGISQLNSNLRFLVKKFSKSIIDPELKEFEVKIAGINLYFSSLLLIQIISKFFLSTNYTLLIASIVMFFGTILFKKNKGRLKILSQNFKEIIEIENILEYIEICLLVKTKADKGNKECKIIFDGLVDKIQKEEPNEEFSPLNLDNIWSDDLKVYAFKEKEAFLDHIGRLYYMTIKKHPDYQPLIISYIYFLLDFYNKKKLAIEQFYHLQSLPNIKFSTKFQMIKILNKFESGSEQTKRNSKSQKLKTASKAVIERFSFILLSMIEKATNELIYFSQTILDENPQIKKINSSIDETQNSLSELMEFYKENSFIFDQDFKSKTSFGIFLRDILEEEEEAREVIDDACRMVKSQYKKEFLIENINQKSDLKKFDLPTFVIRQNQFNKKFSFVTCNDSFSAKIGYLKSELFTLDIDQLFCIPMRKKLIFLIQAMAEKDVQKKQIVGFMKKNGYLKFFILEIKMNVGSSGDIFLTCICMAGKKATVEGHILVKNTGAIIGHDAAMLDVVGTEKPFLHLQGLKKIHQVINAQIQDLRKFSGSGFQEGLAVDLKKELMKMKKMENDKKSTFGEEHKYFTTPIHFTVSQSQIFGPKYFIVKIWKSEKKNFQTSTLLDYKKKSLTGGFYFRISTSPYICYEGAFNKKFEDKKSNLEIDYCPVGSKTKIDHSTLRVYQLINGDDKDYVKKIKFKNYGEGIRLKRLMPNGGVIDWYEEIDGVDSELAENEEIALKKFFHKKTQENKNLPKSNKIKKKEIIKKSLTNVELTLEESLKEKYSKITNSLKDKKSLKKISQEEKFPRSIRYLISTLTFGILFFCGFLLASRIFRTSLVSDIKGLSNINFAATFRASDLCTMANNLMDIALRNNGTDFAINRKRESRNKTELNLADLKRFKKRLQSIEKLDEIIDQSIFSVSMKNTFHEFLYAKNVSVSNSGVIKKFTFVEALNQIKSAAYSILQLDVDEIKLDTHEYIFLKENLLQEFLEVQVYFVDLNSNLKPEIFETMRKNMNLMFQIIMTFYIIFQLSLYILVYFFEKRKEEFATLFYYFDLELLKSWTERCEEFVQYIQMKQVNEEEDMAIRLGVSNHEFLGENVGNETDEIHIEDIMSRLRRRKKKGTLISKCGWFKFLLFSISSAAIFIVLVIIYTKNIELEGISGVIEGIAKVSLVETFMLSSYNTLHMSMHDLEGKFRRSTVEFYRGIYIKLAMSQNDFSLKSALSNYKKTQEFEKYYTQIFNQNACEAYETMFPEEWDDDVEYFCNRIFDGLMHKVKKILKLNSKGFGKVSIAFLDELQDINTYINYYKQNHEDPEWQFGRQRCQKYPYLEPWKRYLKCILGTREFYYIKELQLRYVSGFYRKMSEIAINFITMDIDEFIADAALKIFMILLSIFLLFFGGVLVLYYVGEKYLPLTLVKSNRRMKEFVGKKILEMKSENWGRVDEGIF